MKIYIDSCDFGEQKNRTLLQIISKDHIIHEGVMQNARASLVELPQDDLKEINIHFSIISSNEATSYKLAPTYKFDPANPVTGSTLYNKFINKVDCKKIGTGREDDIIPAEWIYAFDAKVCNIDPDTKELCIIFPNNNNICNGIAIPQVLNSDVTTEYHCNLTEPQLKDSFKQWLFNWAKSTIKALGISLLLMILFILVDQHITFYISSAVYSLIVFIILILPNLSSISHFKYVFGIYKQLQRILQRLKKE